MYIRPTTLGLALLQAATASNSKLADKVVTQVLRNDRPSDPLHSGYNRTMQDNIRVSQKTLSQIS